MHQMSPVSKALRQKKGKKTPGKKSPNNKPPRTNAPDNKPPANKRPDNKPPRINVPHCKMGGFDFDACVCVPMHAKRRRDYCKICR